MKLSIDEILHMQALTRRAVLTDESHLLTHPHLAQCDHCRSEFEKRIEISKALALRLEAEWLEVVTGPLPV